MCWMFKDPVIPNIPSSIPSDQIAFFSALKSAINSLTGQKRNSAGYRAVRMSELDKITLGITTTGKSQETSTEVPDAPYGLSIQKGVFAHTLTWTNPADEKVSHVEVWVAVNSQDIGDAYAIGIVTVTPDMRGGGGVFIHSGFDVTADMTYWIRALSYGYVFSEWYPTLVTGGIVVAGEESVSEAVAGVIDILRGETPDLYSALTEYNLYDRCRTSDGRSWESISVTPHTGNEPPNATYWSRSGILMIGDVDGESTVAIDGNLVVDETILARHLQAEIIKATHIDTNELFVGLSIQSENYVATMNTSGATPTGYKFNAYADELDMAGMMYDSTNGLRIFDVNNNMQFKLGNYIDGDYVELDGGDIKFYLWTGTTHTPYKSLRRHELFDVPDADGKTVEIPGYFRTQPKVKVLAQAMETFSYTMYLASVPPVSQVLRLKAVNIIEFDPDSTTTPKAALTGTGRWRCDIIAKIIASSAGTWSDNIAGVSASVYILSWWWVGHGGATVSTASTISPVDTTQLILTATAQLTTNDSRPLSYASIQFYLDITAGPDAGTSILLGSHARGTISSYTPLPVPEGVVSVTNQVVDVTEGQHTYNFRAVGVQWSDSWADGQNATGITKILSSTVSYTFTPEAQSAAGDVVVEAIE